MANEGAILPAHFLDYGFGGKDPMWDDLVRYAFTRYSATIAAEQPPSS
jgi:hypothetical protein